MEFPANQVPDDARPARIIGVDCEGRRAIYMYTDNKEPEFAYGSAEDAIDSLFGDPVFITADTIYFCA